MKVATILPTKFLHLIKDDNYHMCLAHLIGEDEEYTKFYQQIGKSKGKYLIMDNGVMEGNQRPIEEIIRKANLVGADEIILPDSFCNMNETLDKSYKALQYVREDFPHLKVMVVPQGKNLEEWLECTEIMLSWDIDTLGIPKVLVKLAGRDGRLEALLELGHKVRGLDIHLLGCWQSPIEVLLIEKASKTRRIYPVRGVDSSIAYIFTKVGLTIDEDDKPHNNPIDFDDEDIDIDLLKKNIQMWKDACELKNDDIWKIWEL